MSRPPHGARFQNFSQPPAMTGRVQPPMRGSGPQLAFRGGAAHQGRGIPGRFGGRSVLPGRDTIPRRGDGRGQGQMMGRGILPPPPPPPTTMVLTGRGLAPLPPPPPPPPPSSISSMGLNNRTNAPPHMQGLLPPPPPPPPPPSFDPRMSQQDRLRRGMGHAPSTLLPPPVSLIPGQLDGRSLGTAPPSIQPPHPVSLLNGQVALHGSGVSLQAPPSATHSALYPHQLRTAATNSNPINNNALVPTPINIPHAHHLSHTMAPTQILSQQQPITNQLLHPMSSVQSSHSNHATNHRNVLENHTQGRTNAGGAPVYAGSQLSTTALPAATTTTTGLLTQSLTTQLQHQLHYHQTPQTSHLQQQQQQQQQAVTKSPTAAEIAAAWTEHTAPSGQKYYYNSITKISDFTKPECFQSKGTTDSLHQQKQQQLQQGQPTTVTRPWGEYTDPTTGRKYYSNGVTTTWERPPELAGRTTPTPTTKPGTISATASGSIHQTTTNTDGDTVHDPPRKKVKLKKDCNTAYGSKDEAIAAFKGLLIAKDVSPALKWNEVVKLISSDPRWEACEEALSTGERKQALAEYQTKRTNELRMLERQEKVRAREAFTELLKDSLPKIKSFSAWNTHFEAIRDILTRDDRFHAVADEGTRESLFLDFCEEFRKTEERKKRNKKREAQEEFLSFLREKEEQGLLTFASTWNSFLSSLDNEARTDSRFALSPYISDSDRQLYFADFVIELQTIEDDKRRRIRDARRRAEQAQRDAFRETLQFIARDSNKILPWTRWRDIEDMISKDATYRPLSNQSPDAPRELFEEFISEWHRMYRHDRALLSNLMHPSSQTQIVVTLDMSYEAFTNALLESASSSTDVFNEARAIIGRADPVSSARVFFHELLCQELPQRPGRRGSALRASKYDSSEDEGEIVEEGEISSGKVHGYSSIAVGAGEDGEVEK